MTIVRPRYGSAFEHDRILNVFFYTSNTDKLLQARLLFMRHGYELRHFKGEREPYDEHYSLGTDFLLKRAIEQVNKTFGIRSVFFVEDTSVRINALSDGDTDFPGLGVKEWFSNTTFDQLHRQLGQRGSERGATVYSDIALYIPTLTRPIFFHGETKGTIALSAPGFEASIQYPWLTPTTFNGWFIPEGSERRLGEMELEESLAYDFRAKSITAMLSRIEELNAALSLKPNFYTVRRPSPTLGQLSLLPEQTRFILLIIGDKCAGKSTFSDYTATYEGVQVYEASSILRGIAEELGENPNTADQALAFLSKRGWSTVAERLARYIESSTARWNVVTGLRTPEELFYLKDRFPEARIIVVSADARIRFERHIKRARDLDVGTFQAFKDQDEKQKVFGVLRVTAEIADVVINNESSIAQYQKRIDDALNYATGLAPVNLEGAKSRQFSELHRCLGALDTISAPASCEIISDETAKFGARVRAYNANRALKGAPEFAKRIEGRPALLQYQITQRGRTLLKLLNLVKGSPWVRSSNWQIPIS
jgi:inosine/xanthosine triphosphate pyrophosphatase family protein/dephospho-CoA kinase